MDVSLVSSLYFLMSIWSRGLRRGTADSMASRNEVAERSLIRFDRSSTQENAPMIKHHDYGRFCR